MNRNKCAVLLYTSNLIDYARLILILIGWYFIDDQPVIFLFFYITQAILDFFDGYFARKLNQVSSFGALLDVVIDNFTRGILWTNLHKFGLLIVCIEFLTFSFTQKNGPEWKKWFDDAPFLVKKVMNNNFRSPLGITAIVAGLHGLPIWLYAVSQFGPYIQTSWLMAIHAVTMFGIFGRLICLNAEIWIIYKNLNAMLMNDAAAAKVRQRK